MRRVSLCYMPGTSEYFRSSSMFAGMYYLVEGLAKTSFLPSGVRFSKKDWNTFQEKVRTDYEKGFEVFETTMRTNFNFVLFEMPQKFVEGLRHNWTLTDTACYIPAWFGAFATLALALLAQQGVAQPESHSDYCRWISSGATFLCAAWAGTGCCWGGYV